MNQAMLGHFNDVFTFPDAKVHACTMSAGMLQRPFLTYFYLPNKIPAF
jgi:hypothetical protein